MKGKGWGWEKAEENRSGTATQKDERRCQARRLFESIPTAGKEGERGNEPRPVRRRPCSRQRCSPHQSTKQECTKCLSLFASTNRSEKKKKKERTGQKKAWDQLETDFFGPIGWGEGGRGKREGRPWKDGRGTYRVLQSRRGEHVP